MIGFYSVMRNLQEDYATYHQNYSEEALALLSKSYDFIESVEAVRSLDSLSSIDDDGINNPDASVGVCCSHKVVAVGFNTLRYDASVGVLNPPHE